jgi:hypothetical protein
LPQLGVKFAAIIVWQIYYHVVCRKRRLDPDYRAREAKLNSARQRKYRTDLISLLGGKCTVCEFSDTRALQVDHIHGGGRREHKDFGSTAVMCCYYLQHLDEAKTKLRVLCANCNWIKRAEFGKIH